MELENICKDFLENKNIILNNLLKAKWEVNIKTLKFIKFIILDIGVDINHEHHGNTFLVTALKSNYKINIIKLLINKETNLNQRFSVGRTPLMIALKKKYNDINIIKLLIDKKADSLNLVDNGEYTPLMHALDAQCNDINIIKLLMNEKTDLNHREVYDDYNNPLMVALYKKCNNINILKLLVDEETDLNKKNCDGYNPFNYLLEKNYLGKSFFSILSFFYSIDKELMINSLKLCINDENSNYLLKNPVFDKQEKDIYGWNLLNYLFWNKRKRNINYLLIFSY